MEPATIESLITKAAQLTLFVLMLGMGLNLTLRQITALGQNRGLLLRALLASFVLVPIAAVIILSVIPLTASTRIGIFLMALTPGALLIYRRVSQLGWDAAFAVSYQVMVSLLAIAFLPVAAVIVSHLFPNQAIVTPLEIFKQVLATQFIPLIMGLSIEIGISDLANSLENFVTRIGNFMFLALAILILIKGLEDVLHARILPIIAIVLITTASLAIGHFLGKPDPTIQITLAIANTMQNAGLTLVITVLNFTKAEILPTIIVYALVAALAVTIYHSRYKHILTPAK